MDVLTSGLLGYLSLLWIILTVIWLALATYRAVLASREEDTIFLAKGEAKKAEAQHVLMDKLKSLSKPLWVSGMLSGVLFLLIFGIWLWRAVNSTP